MRRMASKPAHFEHHRKARVAKIHEKTAGMTLYRLAQDGLARREGGNVFRSATTKRKTPVLKHRALKVALRRSVWLMRPSSV